MSSRTGVAETPRRLVGGSHGGHGRDGVQASGHDRRGQMDEETLLVTARGQSCLHRTVLLRQVDGAAGAGAPTVAPVHGQLALSKAQGGAERDRCRSSQPLQARPESRHRNTRGNAWSRYSYGHRNRLRRSRVMLQVSTTGPWTAILEF